MIDVSIKFFMIFEYVNNEGMKVWFIISFLNR